MSTPKLYKTVMKTNVNQATAIVQEIKKNRS
jgi:hypothetical protein